MDWTEHFNPVLPRRARNDAKKTRTVWVPSFNPIRWFLSCQVVPLRGKNSGLGYTENFEVIELGGFVCPRGPLARKLHISAP
jgi:hypothetical protein